MKRNIMMVFRNLFLFHMDGLSYAGMASHAERYSEEQRYQTS